ncbi:hypothetical protein ACOME3_005226 [Neoechinorhynchus agilis]
MLPSRLLSGCRFLAIERLPTITAIRTHTNRDWKPGLYPKAEAERLDAAVKYNLHPADYKPMSPDFEIDMGDYPDLVPVTVDQRDPYHDWDDMTERRDYNEPFTYEYYEFYQPRRLSSRYKMSPISFAKKVVYVFGAGIMLMATNYNGLFSLIGLI